MPNNLLRIQGFNTDDAGISFYKPDGTVYRLSFISDGSLRYGKFINGAWTGVGNVLTNANFLTKTVKLTQVTVPENSGTTGSTTNISAQIPAGYKLFDAREAGSGNNGCYIYFFNVDGVNITLQLRNVTNAAITTTPLARLLLIPK